MRRVTVLGATGSVGRSTLEVIAENPGRFEIASLVAGRDVAGLAELAVRTGARFAALADESGHAALREALAGTGIASGAGPAAVIEAAEREAEICVAAIAGAAGLAPTLAALAPGRTVALANKESLVCAGSLFMERAARSGAEVVPMDSEHNALFQALAGRPISSVEKMILTASGGPFRGWSAERIAAATPDQALAHPNWSMGAKITVDSASLMNKGLELIEAHHLFGLPPGKLDAVVHPQSIVHGMVAFHDGSVVAGLGLPDMRVPIAHCLSAEPRLPAPSRRLDLTQIGTLSFEPVDEARFRCFALAKAALAAGGAMGTVLNAANEVAVAAFLDGSIRFAGIAATVERVCSEMAEEAGRPARDLEDLLAVDHVARKRAAEGLPGRRNAVT